MTQSEVGFRLVRVFGVLGFQRAEGGHVTRLYLHKNTLTIQGGTRAGRRAAAAHTRRLPINPPDSIYRVKLESISTRSFVGALFNKPKDYTLEPELWALLMPAQPARGRVLEFQYDVKLDGAANTPSWCHVEQTADEILARREVYDAMGLSPEPAGSDYSF